jgi:hypothetical protein
VGNLNKIIAGTILVTFLMSMPLSVFALIDKPPTPEFTMHYYDHEIVVNIKNIDFDLPNGYLIRYNIRIQSSGNSGWVEGYQDYNSPIQDPSGYTTIIQEVYGTRTAEERIVVEVQAFVCHYEVHIAKNLPPPFDDLGETRSNFTYVDSTSDWSSPQSISVSTNGATGIPTTITPNTPKPTQTITPTTTTSDNQSNLTQWVEQLRKFLGFNWELVALSVLAVIIAALIVVTVTLWRKVGNLTDKKQHG